MEEIILRDDFIKLGQAIKAAGLVESGVEAKIVIQDGEVKVNGVVETQRGKKLFGGHVVFGCFAYSSGAMMRMAGPMSLRRNGSFLSSS